MELFDKVGEVASQTYKITTEKADRFAKELKLKMKINENKSKIENLYNEIGEAIYRIHINGENSDAEESIRITCNEIDEIAKQISQMSEELLKIKDKRQCKNCHQEIDRESKYCPNCGCEQEKEKNEETKADENNSEETIENNDDIQE